MSEWSPTDEVLEELLVPEPAQRLHAMLDAEGPSPMSGDPLPALWHWIYFLPNARQADLGVDGHPALGSFLPPVPYPKRMFAGSEVVIDRPVVLGTAGRRVGSATPAQKKEGNTGPLAFVGVHYDLTDDRGGSISEQQQIVYRPLQTSVAAREVGSVPDWPWRYDLAVDERMLFRFSALTYNAHRIHYDHPYVTGVEGYPGLLVHGTLLAIGLAEVLRREVPERAIRRFRFRALRPAFAPTTLRFLAHDVGEHIELLAVDHEDVELMTATAVLDGP